MKKHLLMLFVVIVAAAMSLKAQTIVIDDGFENGIQDSVWTQEFVIGEHPWAVESIEDNVLWPATIWQGSKRAYLRNTSGETEGYVTRLVSKVMDLSPAKVYLPELTFWYANPKWTADRDTLRVLYKTSAKADWKQLAEFSTASANWQKVKLELPEVGPTYQIAFEGTDNLGRGIVLDSVKLRSAPECTVPHDIAITNKGAGLINIAWNASWDANFFELVVSKNLINPDTVNLIPDSLGIVAFHDQVSGLQQNYDLQLVSGEYYYVYLRSICETETSMWNSEDPNQGQYRFRVKATKNVPYAYGFDMPYEAGTVRRDLEWTWGNNTGKFNPFINVNTETKDLGTYSKSATTCVVFTGANNLTSPIPANKYAYVATPALSDTANANFSLNQCSVHFWGTVYQYTGRAYAHALIVGVMTDPEDITTFEPIDTVSIWGTSTFQEFVVDLSAYQGTAGYVAFQSAFDTKNIFFLDDISIEYTNGKQVPTNIAVNPRDVSAEITWSGNSPAYNVMITNEEVNPVKATAAQIVAQTQVTTNSYKTEALEADHSWDRPYYVYVQGVKGEETSAWSYRYPFVTVAAPKAAPYTYTFEKTAGVYTIGESTVEYPKEIGMFSNDPEFPHIVNSNAHAGSSCLNLTKDWGNDSWITLPMVSDSLKNLQVKFYLSGSSTPAQAYAIVGVMTNPMDINTFVPVSDCKLASTGYTLCYANFLNYNGPEGFIAIVWGDVDGGKKTINYIDDVTVEAIEQCLPPVNIVTDALSDSVTVSWDKSNATSWEFVLANKQLTAAQQKDSLWQIAALESVLFADTLVWEDPLNDPTFGFDSLKYNTPYYIYVRTMCGENVTWWVGTSFTTPCPNDFPIPFSENFESYSTGAYENGFNCWQVADYVSGATGYPKILKPSSGAQDGNMLELWSTSTTHRNLAMLPGVAGNLSDMVLSFQSRSYGTGTKSVLYVGSMGDISDWTSFVAIDTIYMDGGNEFTTVRMDLSQYNLAFNNIAFTSGLGETLEMNSDMYLDNVSIKPNTCIEAWNIEDTDITPNSIDIKWDGKTTNDEWKITVVGPKKDTIVNDSTIVGKAFHVEGLAAATEYTFFIQPSCDTVLTSASFITGCVKLDPTKPNKETFDGITDATTSYKATSQIPCWNTGNANPGTGTSYLPFVYKGNAASSPNTYRAYATATYGPAYITSPEIECENMKELGVTFNMYATTSYWWVCGVMSDPTDLSTFYVLDSVKGTGASVQYTYDLSEYDSIPADAKYFAWRTRYGSTDYFYLDDVSISKITCPLTKPSYSGLTAESVEIYNGLRVRNNWLLLVTTKEIKADSLAVANVDSLVQALGSAVIYYDTLSAMNVIAEVEGLKEQTDYYVATATLCEDGPSTWATLSFTTPCKAAAPEALGIDGTIHFSKKEGYVAGTGTTAKPRELPCWTIGNKSGNAGPTSSYIPYVYTTSTYLFGTQKDSVLLIESYNPSSATSTKYNGAYAIMPELDVDDISKYQVNFWARANSTTTYGDELIVGVVSDPSDLNTFVVIDTLKLSHTAYEPFSVSLEDYQGDYQGKKGRYIMFTNECTGSITYNYSMIASISVEAIPSCRPVTEFKVDSIAEDAAVISWKQYSSSYRMMVADEEVAENKKDTYKWLLDTVVTKTDSVLITGLAPASQYYVYAQALCEGGDSSAISMAYANILTDCPVVSGYPVPYYNDFDNSPKTGSGNKPLCWDGVYMTMDTVSTSQTYPYVYTTASYAASKPNSVYMYSYGYWNNTDKKYTSNTRSYAVAPKVAGDLSEYMVSFYARKGGTTASYGNKLRVGYVTDASEHGIDTTFVKIADVEVTTATQQPYQVIISDYVNSIPADARIALLADWSIQDYATPTANTSYYGTMYIDNFKIGMPPACFAPTLEPGNTSLYTADVTIVPAKAWNDKWQIAVVPDSVYSKADYNAAKYLAGDDVRIVDADSANFTISGLTPGTQYWLYARTICGGEDGNSVWTDLAVSTRTKYYFKDSYYFGFEKSEGWEYCQGSTSTTYWINPAIQVGYNGGTATTSYTSYYPYCMGNTTSAVYAYGPLEKTDPQRAVLRWYSTSTYYGGYAVFPGVAEAHDRSFEFKVRCGYGSYNSAKDTVGISSNYACEIEVGTIDKNKGYETYEVLSTIYLPVIPKVKGGLTEANDWFWTQVSIDLDSAIVANKQMVLRLPKSPDSNSRYIHFDDVTLGAAKGFGLVSINKVHAESQQATVIWDNLGGPWNLYITNYNEKTKKTDTIATYTNLSGVTSQVVTGLQPQTSYTAILVAANAPANTKFKVSDSSEFRTPCKPIEANENGEFYWNFDDPNDTEPNDILAGAATDTAYLKPSCFTTGTNYTGSYSNGYQWLWQSKGHDYYSTLGNPSDTYNHREIGYNDSYGSLRVYTSSTYVSETVKTWIVLPELKCSFDTMMIEFWGRCLANQDETASTNAGKVISTTYLGASYSKSLVIGTLTDPKDFSTLEVIDTVTYVAPAGISTSTLVSSDKTGNRFWQQFRLPLAGTSGKYIVLFQPAYGLFFVDDLKIKPVGDNLFAPSGPQTSDVTATSATFNWIARHPAIQTVVVVTDQAGTTEILRDTVPGSQMTYTVDTLKPATGYQWSVYQTNGTVSTLSTGTQMFYTECTTVEPDYTNGFELADGWRILPAQTSDTYKQTLCWTYENAGSSAVSTYIYNYANATTLYSHEGDYALRLYASGTTYQTYAAMPAIEDVAAYDTLQVNFWMRPAYASSSTGKISTQYTLGSTAATKEYYYAKSVIVGTMTDPMDATTFVPIDTVTYKGTLSTSDVVNKANDYLFQQKKVALTGAKGKYVAFMATLWAKGAENKSTYDYVWIDDISFSPIQHCNAPEEMNAEKISATNATLTWNAPEGAAKYELQVSTDYTFAEDTAFVFNDTVTTNTVTVTGLAPFTEYVWRVRTICGEDLGESEFSTNATFTTARQPFFVETFGAADLEADWSFATNPAILVIDSANVELSGSNSTSYGWRRVTNNYGIDGAHYAVIFYSSSSATTIDYDYYWMISPVISLDTAKTSQLTFDIAMTGCSGSSTIAATQVQEAQMADDYTFMVALSDDGGKTWKKDNILAIWNNTLPAGQQLRDIPFKPANLRIDLAKYAGKDVRIAFYREADTYKGSSPYTCAVHIDNIRINYYDVIEDDATACQYEDIDKIGFFIDGDVAQAGDTTYRRLEKAYDFDANTKGYKDSIYVLNVTYYPVEETIIADTICEGASYTDLNFHGKERAGIYRRKMQSVLNCDSIVTLHLNVTPRAYGEDEYQTLCPGASYTWNDKTYDRAGLYRDTTTSVAGCDSVMTLILSYYDAEDTIYDATKIEESKLPFTYTNEAYPYIVTQTPIYYAVGTEPGTYVDTVLVQGTNCTAVLVHTLEIYRKEQGIEDILVREGAHKVIIRDQMYIIFKDEWYNAEGKKVSDPRK